MANYLNNYDVVIVGGGIASLGAALPLAKAGKSVLVLEQHLCPGGVATSFKRNGYEFEASLHEMMSVGSKEDPHQIRQFFNQYDIDIDWLKIPEAYRLYSKADDIDITVPIGFEAAAKEIEKVSPGSYDSVMLFFKWCHKVWEDVETTRYKKVSGKDYIKKHFELMISSTYSAKEMMNHCHIPEKAQKILSAYWVYLGSPVEDLPFTPWAYLLTEYLNHGSYFPRHNTSEIAYMMAEKARSYGAQIEVHQKVDKILVSHHKAYAVKLLDGTVIHGSYIISNAYPNTVYSNMIEPKKELFLKPLKMISSKKMNVSCVQVNAILDESPGFFGFKSYATFVCRGEMNDEEQFASLTTDEPFDYLTFVVNNLINSSAAPSDKTSITITSLPFGDTFKDITAKDYFKKKETMGKKLLQYVGEELGIDLLSHVEEIEIITPVTISHYTGAFMGGIYGYLYTMKDGPVSRTMMKKEEHYFKRLYFVGAHALEGDGMTCVINSGNSVALDILEEMGKE